MNPEGVPERVFSSFAGLWRQGPVCDADDVDARFMLLALEEAERGQGRTAPNPPVGAVVVRDGQVVGRGYHAYAGARHGEVAALDEAGPLADGATLYVTLEPCNHHGRTPPCTERILREGVTRVVVGARDPNPRVPGGGLEHLQAQAISVTLLKGPVANMCEALVRPFSGAIRTGNPYVVAKVAASLDGKIATHAHDARWISSDVSRRLVHRLRDRVDAICVGAGTVLRDDPSLTVRDVESDGRPLRNPLRVVLDRHLKTDPCQRVYGHHLNDAQGQPSALVIHAEDVAPEQRARFDEASIPRVAIPREGDHLSLRAALAALGARGILSVLVEPGPGLLGPLMQAQLIDELWWFSAPLLIGADGVPAMPALGAAKLSQAVKVGALMAGLTCGPDALRIFSGVQHASNAR